MKFFVTYWVCAGAFVWFVYTQDLARAAEPPLVEKGKIYQIIWSCLPQVGCYSEAFRVESIRADGWLDVKQCTKDGCFDPWRINPALASAIRPYTLGAAAD
jgi:hypothetical protein